MARVTFEAGQAGEWSVVSVRAVRGEGLGMAACLRRVEAETFATPEGCAWILRGVTSHERYVERAERERLVAVSPPLGRPDADCAALIPIRKSAAWWALAQDERRRIFEAQSHHIAIGLEYLPAIARRLYHGRDLGEPFDFLTWFEYSRADAPAFEALVERLRATEEWRHVEREVDVRLIRTRAEPGLSPGVAP